MQKSFFSSLLFSLFLFSFKVNAQSALTMADQFASEAGTIAGVAEACGQNIVEYNSRIVAAVNVLSQSPSEIAEAMTIYQKTLANAQDAQTRLHTIPCGEAVQNFNSLPIMRPDYKTTVIPQLAQMVTPATSIPSSPKVTTKGNQ